MSFLTLYFRHDYADECHGTHVQERIRLGRLAGLAAPRKAVVLRWGRHEAFTWRAKADGGFYEHTRNILRVINAKTQ